MKEVKVKDVKLDKEMIDKIFTDHQTQGECLGALLRVVYPNIDQIEMVDGWPICSDATWEYICKKFIDLDNKYNATQPINEQIFAGGLWMNRGFSTDRNMGDWLVEPAPYTLLADKVVADV